jgi:AraC-like DNA-binding protein
MERQSATLPAPPVTSAELPEDDAGERRKQRGKQQLRMHLASQWLRDPHATIAEVATRLGYESEASFSRAFKRLQGISPSERRSIAVPLSAASPGP